jgi:hypothetical protein
MDTLSAITAKLIDVSETQSKIVVATEAIIAKLVAFEKRLEDIEAAQNVTVASLGVIDSNIQNIALRQAVTSVVGEKASPSPAELVRDIERPDYAGLDEEGKKQVERAQTIYKEYLENIHLRGLTAQVYTQAFFMGGMKKYFSKACPGNTELEEEMEAIDKGTASAEQYRKID